MLSFGDDQGTFRHVFAFFSLIATIRMYYRSLELAIQQSECSMVTEIQKWNSFTQNNSILESTIVNYCWDSTVLTSIWTFQSRLETTICGTRVSFRRPFTPNWLFVSMLPRTCWVGWDPQTDFAPGCGKSYARHRQRSPQFMHNSKCTILLPMSMWRACCGVCSFIVCSFTTTALGRCIAQLLFGVRVLVCWSAEK